MLQYSHMQRILSVYTKLQFTTTMGTASLILTVAVAVLSCIVAPASSACSTDISAPEISLIELHDGCSKDTLSRNPDCVSAVHRYCTSVSYKTPRTIMGVTREHKSTIIGLSCIDAVSYSDVSISELKQHHSECNLGDSQGRDCLAAVHRYCITKHHGDNYAGISQEVGNDYFSVGCFKVTHKESVSVDTYLTAENPLCTFPESQSDRCFSAASRYCARYHASAGGITQEVGDGRMTVACYNASYFGDAFITRTDEFDTAKNEASDVCELNFDIPAGILLSNPEVLSVGIYDNSQSDTELTSSFEISESKSATSRFEISSSITVSATATFSVGIPTVVEGSLELSTSLTVGFSTSEEVTETSTYSHTSKVAVPPFRKIMKEATITRSNLEVPWTAKVRNNLGTIVQISGTWHGVETYGLMVTQRCV